MLKRGQAARARLSGGLTILADQSLPLEERDSAKLDAAIANSEEEIARAKTDEARRVAVKKPAARIKGRAQDQWN